MSQDPHGFDFEQLRKMLEQMGLDPSALGMDLEKIMEQAAQMQSSGLMFGMTPADQDPEAAWRTTLTAAQQLVNAQGADPALEAHERRAIVDAERLVQAWLDPVTSFAAPDSPGTTMLRDEWLELTADSWRAIVQPIIDGLGDALERGGDSDAPDELSSMTAMFAPMMRTSASMLYRDRLKRVLADVACDTLTGSEIGINLLPKHQVGVLATNIAEFTRDLDLPEMDVMLYLLLREAARQRLFAHVGWLSPQLSALLAHYAREIRIDLESIAQGFDPEKLQSASMEDFMQIGEELRGSFFKPASTPTQLEILGRLELLLALIEGWVGQVTAQVTSQWMPNGPQLNEMLRRRRAAGSATQAAFSQLIGLDLRPRFVRDAENLWAAIEHERGAQGRDEVWRHPDVIPTEKDLEDPIGFARRQPDTEQPAEDDLDRELRRLLEGDSD